MNAGRIAAGLAAIVGDEHVTTDETERVRLSQDLGLEPFEVAEAVVAPGTADEVVSVVGSVREAGLALAVRGGGMSYTRAHVPQCEGVVMIDMRRLDRILEVNARDLYVTVEAGCTWEALYLALRTDRVRTPFWGPLSGRVATIGGTLSQNALFLGFAGHGLASKSVLGLEVVLGDATRMRTGSGAHRSGSPFWREFGPDLTGLFLGDSGAFGVKIGATLRLLPTPAVSVGASFICDDVASLLAAMEAAARIGVAADLYGFDRFYHAVLGDLGFPYLRAAGFSLHSIVEANDDRSAEVALEALRRSVVPHAREVPASLPLSILADPFGSMRAIFRNTKPAAHLPTNAIVPWSKAAEALRICEAFLVEHAATLAAHRLDTWTMFAASPNGLSIEPALVLDDDLGPVSRAPEARSAALTLRRDLARRFDGLGAMHVQFGKYYEFVGNLEPSTRQFLDRLKNATDPDGVFAPGALGLGEN